MIKAELLHAARSLGVAAAGVSGASVDPKQLDRMRAAIARGDLATWGYDDAYAQAICDPATILAGARSVVCVAVAYAHPAPERARGCGRISNYAWADDYHGHLRRLLDSLITELRRLAPEAEAIAVCDTKPLAERAFAARAGLGWIGKHTNLIVPGSGSFVFLGEIVTNIELEPDTPRMTHCGTCRQCVTACPTGALRADYTMDATRCISDLTQRRDTVPRALRPFIGEWIWGCDICQDACPPVARAPRMGSAAYAPQLQAFPDLLELLAMPPHLWRKRYARSPMGWRGASVMRRNAAIALGNGGDRAHVPALLMALTCDRSALVRAHTAWALGRIASPAAFEGLHRALASEPNVSVREEMFAAIDDIAGTTLVHTNMEASLCF